MQVIPLSSKVLADIAMSPNRRRISRLPRPSLLFSALSSVPASSLAQYRGQESVGLRKNLLGNCSMRCSTSCVRAVVQRREIGLYFQSFSLNSHHYSPHQFAGSGLGPRSDPDGVKYMDVFHQMIKNLSSIPLRFATIP